MKKILLIAASVIFSLVCLSCESSDTKNLTKEEKAILKEQKKQKKDAYTGWIYIPDRKFSITKDDIKIEMNGSTGSFCLYAIPEVGKPVPLLSNYDSTTSTFFSVKIGRKEYRLNRENGVKSEARRTPYGAQMAYLISGEAQIVVDFSFLPSIATSSRVDMLRVTVYTINLGKHTQSFAIKGVFDTVLGENTDAHFSTAAKSRINSEMQLFDLSDDLWIRSSNGNTSLQMLLCGKGINSPSYVTLANKDALALPMWVPQVQDTKSFSSVISYNNSAVGLNWKTAYIDPNRTSVITFYISVGIGGNEPAGKNFLASLAEGKTALSAKIPPAFQTTNVAPDPAQISPDEIQTVYHENMPAVTEGPVQTIKDTPVEVQDVSDTEGPVQVLASVEEEKEELPETTAAAVTKEQLDPEYIQKLLDHIAALEEDGSGVNDNEIQYLNEELDSILKVLNSME